MTNNFFDKFMKGEFEGRRLPDDNQTLQDQIKAYQKKGIVYNALDIKISHDLAANLKEETSGLNIMVYEDSSKKKYQIGIQKKEK